MGDVPGVWGELGADPAPLKRGVKQGREELGRFTKTFKMTLTGLGQNIKQLGDSAAAAGRTLGVVATAMLAPLGVAISRAADFQESLSKFRIVFRQFSDDALAWSEDFAERVGRSRREVIAFMASTQDLFVPLGFTRERAAELSKQVVTLAVDVASLNNELDADVVNMFQSALVGNHEAVRRLGVSITEYTLKQELLNMGIEGGVQQATQQQKVMARLNLIIKATPDAIGDAERTAGSYTGQSKRLRAEQDNLAVTVGDVLLPEVTKLVTMFAKQIKALRVWIKENPEAVKQYTETALWIGKIALALAALAVFIKTTTMFIVLGAGIKTVIVGLAKLLLFLGPVGWIALGFIALTAVIVTFRKEIAEAFRGIGERLKTLRDRIAETFRGIRDRIAETFRSIRERLRTLRDRIAEAFGVSKKLVPVLGTAGIREFGPVLAPVLARLPPAPIGEGMAVQRATVGPGAAGATVVDNRAVTINVEAPVDEASLAARVRDGLARDSYRKGGL